MSVDWMTDYRKGTFWGGVTCSVCGLHVEHGVTLYRSGVKVEYCRLHDPHHVIDRCKNPFASFTLDHVKDEHGQKVKVNSLAELRAAEKRYGFALAVATDDGGSADRPPQHESHAGDITHGYERKFNRDPDAYRNESARQGVSAGVARDRSATLADRPNPV